MVRGTNASVSFMPSSIHKPVCRRCVHQPRVEFLKPHPRAPSCSVIVSPAECADSTLSITISHARKMMTRTSVAETAGEAERSRPTSVTSQWLDQSLVIQATLFSFDWFAYPFQAANHRKTKGGLSHLLFCKPMRYSASLRRLSPRGRGRRRFPSVRPANWPRQPSSCHPACSPAAPWADRWRCCSG